MKYALRLCSELRTLIISFTSLRFSELCTYKTDAAVDNVMFVLTGLHFGHDFSSLLGDWPSLVVELRCVCNGR